MKNLFKNLLGIFILTLASTYQVFSQEIVVSKVPPPDGQTSAEISGFAQDQNGFMWISTRNGLYRYDGYQFIHYKNNPQDPNSLVSDLLISLAIDLNGKIWIGTMGYGLECFDPVTGQFKHYRHEPKNQVSIAGEWINSLLIDREGTLWVGSNGGLDRYDDQNDSFFHYQNIPGDSTTLSYNGVSTLYEDKDGTIWVGTGSVWDQGDDYKYKGGLNRMNKSTGTFIRYLHDPNNQNSLIDNKVSAIFEDSKGTFWVGTAGDGLHTMDRENGTFTRHTYDPKHPEKLSRPPFNEKDRPREHIGFIKEDDTGAIWIGTFESGLVYYNPETKTKKSGNDFNGDNIDKMPGCIFSSREGMIWIGTDMGNIYCINPFQNKIPHYITSSKYINSFYEEPNGIFWMLTESELIRNDQTNGIFKREVIDENPSTIAGSKTKIIKEDQQGNVWIGSKNGLFRWDKMNESFINYKINPNNKFSSGNKVWTIYEDRKANLWIGKARGLNLLNRETGSVTEFLIHPNDTAEFGKNGITSILEDKTGKFWIGTWSGGGLYQFNTETKVFKNVLNDKSVSYIFEDTEGVLWVGCFENLYRYDRGADNFIPYFDPNSPSGITVTSMVEDNQKYLWIGTWNKTIVRLNPQRNASVVYDKSDGVKNDLVWNATYKARNGNLYFGDETGYFSFDPSELTKNTKPPQIVFTNFLLADEIVKPGNGGPLKESLTQAKEIQLNYNQNIFSFEFAAIDYSNPEKNQHFCMLENYDIDWRKSNSERRAYYFNVPPGKYAFRVKAMSSTGAWAEKKIDVIILPPWWRTWWAYCLYGLIFISAVFGIDRFQRRRLLKAEKERNRERELAQAKEIEKAYTELKSTQSQLIQSEKMASLGELTAGIAHEIQNPLNFVNNFSEISNELIEEMDEELAVGNMQLAKEIAGDIKQNLQKINHHGKRAADIVKGMLQHSRTSSGQKEPTDINALADEYLRLAYHGLRAKDKSFNAEFKTDFDESLPKINVIPQDIGRVLLNLINNAFYAVDKRAKENNEDYKPLVVVNTHLESSPLGGPARPDDPVGRGGQGIKISVKDNGSGIPLEIKDKIFQPFFTTKPTGQGTGLGLSLAYDIVKAHGGELKVETKPARSGSDGEGVGSEFIITLPFIS